MKKMLGITVVAVIAIVAGIFLSRSSSNDYYCKVFNDEKAKGFNEGIAYFYFCKMDNGEILLLRPFRKAPRFVALGDIELVEYQSEPIHYMAKPIKDEVLDAIFHDKSYLPTIEKIRPSRLPVAKGTKSVFLSFKTVVGNRNFYNDFKQWDFVEIPLTENNKQEKNPYIILTSDLEKQFSSLDDSEYKSILETLRDFYTSGKK